MDTILFITDLHTGSRIPELAGVREEAANMDWHVEEIEVQRLKHPIKTVLKYWKPIGCILEGSSNLLPPNEEKIIDFLFTGIKNPIILRHIRIPSHKKLAIPG